MPTVIYDLGSLATWLSALGTTGATSLALYLILRDRSDRLGFTVSAENSRLVIIVFNKGVRPVAVRDIQIELGRFKPDREQSIESILAGRGLPKLLRTGEYVQFDHELNRSKSYLPDRLFQVAKNKHPWNRQVYFVVSTGSGRSVRYKLPAFDRSALVQEGL